jgi:hypothetical protein
LRLTGTNNKNTNDNSNNVIPKSSTSIEAEITKSPSPSPSSNKSMFGRFLNRLVSNKSLPIEEDEPNATTNRDSVYFNLSDLPASSSYSDNHVTIMTNPLRHR